MDLSGIIKSTGAALEAEAFKQFGAAVEKQVSGVLGGIFGNPKKGSTSQSDAQIAAKNVQPGVWEPSKYAAAIASGAGGYDPKTKFLFKVKFTFSSKVSQAASSMVQGVDLHDVGRDLTFTIKQIDLPKVNFEYENVNMYNFKTKVLKSIDYRELSLSFYDDVANHSLSFMNVYLMLLMPITRMAYTDSAYLENHGFAFAKSYFSTDTSHRGILPDDAKDIISRMTIEQFYLVTNQQGSPIDAVKVNSFVFTNPRLIMLDVSDQDYEMGNAANIISATLNFDALHMETGGEGVDYVSPSLSGNDILDGTEEIAAQIKRGSQVQAGKAKNPFVEIIARQGQRAVQSTVSGFLNKKLGTIAGGALGGAIGQISGALGSAAENTLRSVSTGISQGIAIPRRSSVKDNSTTAQESSANTASQSSTDNSG